MRSGYHLCLGIMNEEWISLLPGYYEYSIMNEEWISSLRGYYEWEVDIIVAWVLWMRSGYHHCLGTMNEEWISLLPGYYEYSIMNEEWISSLPGYYEWGVDIIIAWVLWMRSGYHCCLGTMNIVLWMRSWYHHCLGIMNEKWISFVPGYYDWGVNIIVAWVLWI